MSMNGYIGERLKASVDFLNARIAELQRDRDALHEAWNKWDLDALQDMEYITATERSALEKEWKDNLESGKV